MSTQTDKPFEAHRKCGQRTECTPRAQCNTVIKNVYRSDGHSFKGCVDNEICCKLQEPLIQKVKAH